MRNRIFRTLALPAALMATLVVGHATPAMVTQIPVVGNIAAGQPLLHRIADGDIKSGGVVSLGGGDATCTEAALNDEATAVIASFGTQPSTASGAWKYAYDVTLALIDLTKAQAARCPEIDLSYAMQYHTTNLEGLERTGRAAGWL